MPVGFADPRVPDVRWVATDLQRKIAAEVDRQGTASTAAVDDAVGCIKEHVRRTLRRLERWGTVRCREAAGDHGADVYRLISGETPSGVVDFGEAPKIANWDVWGSYTWSLAIDQHYTPGRPPVPPGRARTSTRQVRLEGDPPPHTLG